MQKIHIKTNSKKYIRNKMEDKENDRKIEKNNEEKQK